MKRVCLIGIILLVFLFPSLIHAERGIRVKKNLERIALVIGNGVYRSAPLRNPVNDERDMAKALRKMGFEVVHKENATFQTMDQAVMDFGRRLREGGVGLFYFAGHGIQVKGRNYLIPVDAKIESESDVRYKALDAGRVLGKMEDAGNELNIVILDACRNNPFARSFRASNPGLAKMDAPKGSLVVYATAPGSVAADGTGRNGVYTKNFLKYMGTPGITVEKVLKKVRIAVMKETEDKQVPWESSSLRGDFYFIIEGKVTVTNVPPEQGSSGPDSARQEKLRQENLFWQSIRESKDIADFEAYLEQFPNGTFASLAKRRIGKGKEKIEVASLRPESVPKGRLFIDTEPEGARVRILNIKPKFTQGMELAPGKYRIEVYAQGFETETQWIELVADKEKRVIVKLLEGINTGSIRITGTPEGAEVFLNNRFIGKIPVVLEEIISGSHNLEVTLKGYKAEKRQIKLAGRQESNIQIDLEKLIITGRLSISGSPSGAKVYVDGSYMGTLPVSDKEMEGGSYKVEVSADGYKTQNKMVSLSGGENKTLDILLEKSGPKEIARDGVYVAYTGGIVRDTRTGLEWVAGPDRDTDWDQAKSWVESLNIAGGGWRMPTMDELEGLYKEGVGTRNMTSLLNTTGGVVWSGETKCSSTAWLVFFIDGSRYLYPRVASVDLRAFAVRSRNDG